MAICSGSTLLSLLAFLACEPSDRSGKKLSGNEQSDFREESSISIREFEDLIMDLCCRLFQRDRYSFRILKSLWDFTLLAKNALVTRR